MWPQYATGVAVGLTLWFVTNAFTIVDTLWDPIDDAIQCGFPGCNEY